MYKVLIRPLEQHDYIVSWRWRNDEEIWEHTGKRPNMPITAETEKEWIQKVLKQKNSRRFAITVEDKYVGNIQLTNITSETAEFHIFIGDKDYWGKSVGFSATQQIIRFAKNTLKLKQIYLYVKNNNKRAIKLYQKCGFVQVSDEIKMTIDLNQTKQPCVSVFCMVYNHEQFLKQCIEGFLIQKCLFDFEIIIGEDCSTDKSKEILLDYAVQYPGKFKLILHEKNIGAMENQRIIFENCNGQYIAMCEGDDYWTDPFKLQKQVDFMERNSLDACHTLWQENRQGEYINSGFIPNNLNLGDSCIFKPKEFYYYHTSTRVVRKDVINEIMTSFPLYFLCDGPLQVVLSQRKKVGVILDYTSVYRISGSGVWTSLSPKEQALQSVNSCRDFQKYLPESAKKFADEKWYYWLTAKFPRFLNENQRKRVSKNIMKLEFFLRKHVIEIITHP